MAGRVDDVDLDAVVHDGGIFGKDRNAALTLQGIRIHHALLNDFIAAENAALPQKLIDQRRLAVVNVGNNRNVPYIISRIHKTESLTTFEVL